MRSAYAVSSVTPATIRAINYSPATERLRRRPTCGAARGWVWRPLGEVAQEIGRAYARVLVRVDCAPQHGHELLSQVDIFAAEPAGRVIRGDLMPLVEDLRILRGDILIAGAGQIGESTLFGRAIIADTRLTGKLAAADIMVIRFDDPDSAEALYTYAFLLCQAGLRAVRACAYGTSIPRMRPDLLAALPVPLADQGIRDRVADLVRSAMMQREVYSTELKAARGVMEGLPEMQEAHAMCAERKARVVIWKNELPTIMGWTYASHGGSLAVLTRLWKRQLADALEPEGAFYGLLRQRTPCDPGFGVPLITQRDALAVRQIPSWIARPAVAERALFSPAHSIVMAGRGTLGEGELFARPSFITPSLSRFALTQDLLRLVPKRSDAALVYSYLSTLVGRRLLRSCAVGTKILQLRLDLLRRLPLPDLDCRQQNELMQHHERSIAAYDAADAAEAEAIRIIEEEVLPAWLA